MAATLRAPLFFATVSRLVIDLNRTVHHKNAFSELTHELPRGDKHAIITAHYRPYRDEVEAFLRQRTAAGKRVLHLSVHSFTPELYGVVRNAEIGLLYDSRRPQEERVAGALHDALSAAAVPWRIRRNYPYLGKSDGFQSHLRRALPAGRYAGLELEMNQAVVKMVAGQKAMTRDFLAAIRASGLV